MSAALLAASAAVALPAAADHTATPTTIRDVAGDANYVNDGGEFETGDTPTAGSDAGLDVLHVMVRPTTSGPKRAVDGFAVVVDMLAPLRDRAQVTMKTRTQSCPDILVQYVHAAPTPRALLSSGCSPDVVPLAATVQGARLTLTVPYALMPVKSQRDRSLQTINVFSQLHLADEPMRHRPVGVLSADTTLASKSYRLR